MKLRAYLNLLALTGLSIGFGNSQPHPTPVVGVASGNSLSLFDAAGTVVRQIDLKTQVSGFVFSSNQEKLVIAKSDTEHGGALVLINLKTGARKNLTGAPFAFDHLDKGESEVYDAPAFSPDGRYLVFAVHGNQPGDGNDAWENSGPLAVLDLDTGKKRVLKATNNIDGNGPCSESDPRWSGDGKWILFNCEDGAYITDTQGSTLRDLRTTQDEVSVSAIGWVGAHCVLYVQTPMNDGHFDFDHESVKLLELPSLQSTDATPLLEKFNRSRGGLRQASQFGVVRGTYLKQTIETAQKQWEVTLRKDWQSPQTSAIQLLTSWEPDVVPERCK